MIICGPDFACKTKSKKLNIQMQNFPHFSNKRNKNILTSSKVMVMMMIQFQYKHNLIINN